MPGGRVVIAKTACPCGEESTELDHIVSLAIAHARGDRRGILRAYTVGNLHWLCGPCHAKKTGDDQRILANLRAGRPEEWVKPEGQAKPQREVPEGQLAMIGIAGV